MSPELLITRQWLDMTFFKSTVHYILLFIILCQDYFLKKWTLYTLCYHKLWILICIPIYLYPSLETLKYICNQMMSSLNIICNVNILRINVMTTFSFPKFSHSDTLNPLSLILIRYPLPLDFFYAFLHYPQRPIISVSVQWCLLNVN